MDFTILMEFIVLSEERNYAEAADKLNTSEPTLSRHIRQLETELGVKLFDRTSRKVKINKYGEKFLYYAKQLINTRNQCIEDIRQLKSSNNNIIKIINLYYIDDFLSSFNIYDKDVSFELLTAPGVDDLGAIASLKKGECDIVFLNNPRDLDDEIETIEFARDSFVAVLPSSHCLSGRNKITVSELQNDGFISFPKNNPGDLQIKRLCSKAGFEPKVILSANVGSAVAAFVEDGIGVSILMKKSIVKNLKKRPNMKISLVDLDPAEPITVYLCYLKNAKLSPKIKKLINFAQNVWPDIKTIY